MTTKNLFVITKKGMPEIMLAEDMVFSSKEYAENYVNFNKEIHSVYSLEEHIQAVYDSGYEDACGNE